MKTDDLIAALTADTTRRAGVGRRLGWALGPAALVSLIALLMFWGPRSDLAQALGSVTVVKTLLPLALAAAAMSLAVDLSRPEPGRTGRAMPLIALVAGAAGTFLLALASGGLTGLVQALSTPSLWVCLASIPVLTVLPLAAALWALTAGAPIRPARAGGVAGLAAAGVGTGIYSLYCGQDTVLFFLPAYGAAILIVVAAGAYLGAKILKW